MTSNTRGALLMICAMLAFSLNDACMKALSGAVPLPQALLIRGIFTSVVIGAFAMRSGVLWPTMARKDRWLIVWRGAAEVGSAYFFITAIYNMPLGNAVAILQALPLTVTLAGALFLGEVIGWRRMMAILLGFVGVLLIVRPSAEGFNTYTLYALVAVASVTFRDLVTRQLSADVPTLFVALVSSVGVMMFGAIGALFEPWVAMSGQTLILLGGAAFFIIGGYMFGVMTMRVGDVSFVAPFRYTSLVSAMLLGWFVFGDWPDFLTQLGAFIIVASGLFTYARSNKRKGDVA